MAISYAPAAPGTTALLPLLEDAGYLRRTVIGWRVCDGQTRPLVAGPSELVRLWLNHANAVQHPDGRVESLDCGKDWPDAEAWWAEQGSSA